MNLDEIKERHEKLVVALEEQHQAQQGPLPPTFIFTMDEAQKDRTWLLLLVEAQHASIKTLAEKNAPALIGALEQIATVAYTQNQGAQRKSDFSEFTQFGPKGYRQRLQKWFDKP